MKALKIFSLSFLFISFAFFGNAQQSKTETIAVSGNCGMCKSSIEKAAKTAGAKKADWNKDSKILTVSYSASATSTAKIQEAIAAVGYDTRDVKASNESYDKLHACCKYDRTRATEISAKDSKETKSDCCSKEAKNSKSRESACCSEAN